MNAYEAELRQKWDSIDYHQGGSLQLAIPHALDWHVRYVAEDQKSIVIVSEIPVDNIRSSQSIEAACNQRRDGKYAISFTLVNRAQEDGFISHRQSRLCDLRSEDGGKVWHFRKRHGSEE